jgi:single-strand DNA-binding protein
MNTVTAAGIVATTPRHVQTDEGLDITSFRLASNRRRYDDELQQWVDVDTNWYTVVAFRALAANAEKSLRKGDRVVVSGRVRIRDWEHDSGSGTSVEVEADALGHDLLWGTTTYTRSSAGDTDDEEE